MSTMTCEMLSPEQVDKFSDELRRLFDAACAGNEVAHEEITGSDIVELGRTGMAAIFGGFLDGRLMCTIAIQFTDTNGRKGADLIAMAGKRLMKFKAAYWQIILDWLRANGVEHLDAYTAASRAEVYTKKFGFTKTCAYMRMSL